MQYKASILLAVAAVALSSATLSAATTIQPRSEASADNMPIPWLIRSYNDLEGSSNIERRQLIGATSPNGLGSLNQGAEETPVDQKAWKEFQALSADRAAEYCMKLGNKGDFKVDNCKIDNPTPAKCAYEAYENKGSPPSWTEQAPIGPSGLTSLYNLSLNGMNAIASCGWQSDGPHYWSKDTVRKYATWGNKPNEGSGRDSQYLDIKDKKVFKALVRLYESCPQRYCELSNSLSSKSDGQNMRK